MHQEQKHIPLKPHEIYFWRNYRLGYKMLQNIECLTSYKIYSPLTMKLNEKLI